LTGRFSSSFADNWDTGVHPDLLNSRFGYVSISRASNEATLFTDNVAKLFPQFATDVSKTSALEINQSVSVGQGLGMGCSFAADFSNTV
jgi:hypothetical protein